MVEDVNEVINSNRMNNLSQKMTGIMNQSIERKNQSKRGNGSATT